MTKKALLLIAPGVEELEVVTIFDILKRSGIDVYLTGIENKSTIKTRQSFQIKPKHILKDLKDKVFDVVILPGGECAAKTFCETKCVGNLLKCQYNAGRLVAVMCASPLALKKHKIAYGRKLTSYPAMKKDLEDVYKYIEADVVVDDNLITSRGPGTSSDFALTITEKLFDKRVAKTIAQDMLF